jgi:ADP-heptose:LPS heptosyltransferase
MSKNDFIRWRLLPLLFRAVSGRPAQNGKSPVRSIACLRPGKLGDMIVSTPLFSALRQHGGVTRLAVLCSAENEPVIRHNPHVTVVRPVNFHRIGGVINAVRWLRQERFDALIDLTPGFSRTNFLISQLAGRGVLRAGIEKGSAADRYHVHIGGRNTHLADRILDAGEALTGARFPRPRPFEIYTAPDERDAAAEFIVRNKGSGPLIAVNLSAGSPERQWAYGNFAELTRTLVSAVPAGAKLALIAVGAQREWAERLAAADSWCVVVPELSFLTITELISACSLLVSCDTALIHAAAARKVPVVGLYTAHAENLTRWGPYGVASEVIQSSSAKSVNAIWPEAVREKAILLMKKTGLRLTP